MKRKGIREAFDGCRGIADRAKHATKEYFLLAHAIPLPRETKRAADFVSDSNPRDIASFWEPQLANVEALVSPMAAHQKRCGEAILPPIMPSDAEVRTMSIRHLSAQCGIGGARWQDQFAVGFPITWILSQKGVSPLTNPEETAMGHALLFRTAAARCRERATKSGMGNASLLRSDALEKVEKGRMCPPAELAPSGQPAGFPRRGSNIAFRFGS